AGGERLRAVAGARKQQGRVDLAGGGGQLAGGRAVHAQARRDPGGEQLGGAADARAQPGVGGGAVRDAGAGVGDARDGGVGEVHRVREPHVLAQPAELLGVLHRGAAELGGALLLLVEGLGEVGVQPDALVPGQLGGAAHQLGADRERRAGRRGDAGHRVDRRVVVGVDGRGGAGQRAVGGLHHRVRRQAALGVPAVHGAARQVQPDADRAGRLHFGGGDVAPPGGEDVVVVGGGAAARQRQPGGARGGGSGHRLGVQPVPDLVGADQPLEERAVGEQALGGPLVEVVVRVHQAGGGQAAAAVDAARTGDL